MTKPVNQITAPQDNSYFKQELSRVISAAVINRSFCRMLLSDPAAALSVGYGGEKFRLAEKEKERLGEIRASSLTEFAAHITVL